MRINKWWGCGQLLHYSLLFILVICCTFCRELQLEGNTDWRYKLHCSTCMMLFLLKTSQPSCSSHMDNFPLSSTAVSLSALSSLRQHTWTLEQTLWNDVCTVTADDCSTDESDNKRHLLRQNMKRRGMRWSVK